MTDVISRIKLESGEFDGKIKRAAQGIRQMADECHAAGSELNVLENENRKYIQSLGQMQTVSRSARGSVAELTAAFMDIKKVYNELSDDEKNGEFGRELNKQLGILKQRINDGNQEIKDMQQELNGGLGNALDSIAGKFGMNIKQLTGWGAALAAGKVALDVAKDAFFANETQLDEWGRTVQASESLYEGFLNALNTGDISGYISNIDNIISAAREAYDAMDELGTFNAFTRGSRAGMRSNYSEALNEYKLNPTAENKKALDAANKALVESLQQQAGKIKQNYEKALNSLGVNRLLKGQQLDDFKNLFRSGNWEKLESMKAGYKQGSGLNAGSQYWYGDRVYDGKVQDRATGKWRVMEEDERKQFEFARVLAQVNDKQIDAVQALDEQYKNTLDSINNQNRAYNRLAGNNGKVNSSTTTSGRSGSGSTKTAQTELQQNQAKINALTQEYVRLGDDATDSAKERQAEIQKEIELLRERNGLLALRAEQAQGRMLAGAGDFQKEGLKTNGTLFADPTAADSKAMEIKGTLSLQLDEDAMEAVNEQITKSLKKDAKTMQKQWGLVAESVSNIGDAFASIEDPGAKAMGTVMQAIASIALGFAQAASAKDTTASGWAWLAWLAAGTAAMATTISTVHSLTGYADGGIVKGNHYSGDNINGGEAMVNAGELVLNKAQQSTLASQLQDGNGGGGSYLPSHVSGEQIYVVLNRYLKRTGRGELVTWE